MTLLKFIWSIIKLTILLILIPVVAFFGYGLYYILTWQPNL